MGREGEREGVWQVMNAMVMFPCRRCCYKVFKDAMFGRIFTNICTCSLKLDAQHRTKSKLANR